MSLLFALLTGGCASGPYQAALMVRSTKDLNPTFDEKPSSVNVRVFQLIDTGPFLDEAKTTAELFSDEPGLPAETWVQPVVDGNVYIDATGSIELEIKPKVRFLGVVAIFNEQGGESRAVLSVDDIDDKLVFFDRYSLAVRGRDEEPAAAAEATDKDSAEDGR